MTEEKGTQKQKIEEKKGEARQKKAKFPTMSSEQAGEEL